jgi:N-acetylglutamate synthase-like GNAT family acetyltransferase
MFLPEKAKIEDIKEISELFYLLSREDGLKTNKSIFLKNNVHYLREIIDNPNFLVLAVKVKNAIVGASLSKIIFSRKPLISEKIGEISRIFIKDKYRKNGIASILIKKNKYFFKKSKVKRVRVFVFKKNKNAQAFWRHIHFKELMNILEINL